MDSLTVIMISIVIVAIGLLYGNRRLRDLEESSEDSDILSEIFSNYNSESLQNEISEFYNSLDNNSNINNEDINYKFINSTNTNKDENEDISSCDITSNINDNSFINDNLYNSTKTYKNEEEVRDIFEDLFYPVKFPTLRLDTLKNPYTNRCLEIDGMCRIKYKNEYYYIGFEYNGEQHYKYIPHMHDYSESNFQKQKMRDLWKYERCKELGFIVVVIPYNVTNKRSFILKELKNYPDIYRFYRKNI